MRHDLGAGGNANLGSLRAHGYEERLRWSCELVQDVVKKRPYSGHLFVFRGKRADRIKILWWDGTGCAFTRSGWNVGGLCGR